MSGSLVGWLVGWLSFGCFNQMPCQVLPKMVKRFCSLNGLRFKISEQEQLLQLQIGFWVYLKFIKGPWGQDRRKVKVSSSSHMSGFLVATFKNRRALRIVPEVWGFPKNVLSWTNLLEPQFWSLIVCVCVCLCERELEPHNEWRQKAVPLWFLSQGTSTVKRHLRFSISNGNKIFPGCKLLEDSDYFSWNFIPHTVPGKELSREFELKKFLMNK